MNFKTHFTSSHPVNVAINRKLLHPKCPPVAGILSTRDLRRIVAEMLG